LQLTAAFPPHLLSLRINSPSAIATYCCFPSAPALPPQLLFLRIHLLSLRSCSASAPALHPHGNLWWSGTEVYGLYEAAHVSPDPHTKNRPPRFFPPHEPRDAKVVPQPARSLYEKSKLIVRSTYRLRPVVCSAQLRLPRRPQLAFSSVDQRLTSEGPRRSKEETKPLGAAASLRRQ